MNTNSVPKNAEYFSGCSTPTSEAWVLMKPYSNSKMCCSLPGLSAERLDRSAATSTIRMATTRISITSQVSHGRAGFGA